MKATMPQVIDTYFQASNANNIDGLVACFEPNATVEDERATYRGISEIREWSIDVRKKFEFTAKILDATERGAETIITAKLSGIFPGSPVNLDHRFTLTGSKITSLRIVPSEALN